MSNIGTSILLMEKEMLFSPVFDMKMNPQNYGDYFFNRLSKVQNEDDYTFFLKKFNEKHFKHKSQLIYRTNNVLLSDLCNYYNSGKELAISFGCSYLKIDSSDWIFVKNVTGETVEFKTIENQIQKIKQPLQLKHGETARFYFGTINTKYTFLIEANKF